MRLITQLCFSNNGLKLILNFVVLSSVFGELLVAELQGGLLHEGARPVHRDDGQREVQGAGPGLVPVSTTSGTLSNLLSQGTG